VLTDEELIAAKFKGTTVTGKASSGRYALRRVVKVHHRGKSAEYICTEISSVSMQQGTDIESPEGKRHDDGRKIL